MRNKIRYIFHIQQAAVDDGWYRQPMGRRDW